MPDRRIRRARHSWGNFLSASLLLVLVLGLDSAKATEYVDMPSPPDNAPAGQKLDGIQIGLWTEKSVYRSNEIRNVWRFARSDRVSAITIGVGGNLYEDSFLYIFSDGEVLAKLPMTAGMDGISNPTSTAGGISEILSDLPSGAYQLVWKTKTCDSNTIAFEIRND